MTYAVLRDGNTLVRPSVLGIATHESVFAGAAVADVRHRSFDETWEAPWGKNKNKQHRNGYNELAVRLDNRLTLCFRADDNGVAVSFIPQTESYDEQVLK